MMNLKLVTWEGDLTQFLVDALDDDEAVNKAIEANKEFDRYCGENETGQEIFDKSTYDVEDVDFDLLCEIIERDDWFKGTFAGVKVFND